VIDLPENIAAFKSDAANTNEKPIYLGRYMLLSDQDLTSLKHNLIYTCVISTTLVPLLGVVQDPRIPLPIRMLLLGVTFIGLHGAAIALWNLIQSHLQLYPAARPDSIFRWLCAHKRCGYLSAGLAALLGGLFAPSVVDAFVVTFRVLTGAA
jgi:hypothetical protein